MKQEEATIVVNSLLLFPHQPTTLAHRCLTLNDGLRPRITVRSMRLPRLLGTIRLRAWL